MASDGVTETQVGDMSPSEVQYIGEMQYVVDKNVAMFFSGVVKGPLKFPAGPTADFPGVVLALHGTIRVIEIQIVRHVLGAKALFGMTRAGIGNVLRMVVRTVGGVAGGGYCGLAEICQSRR